MDPRNVTLVQACAVAVFLYAWYHQFVAHKILAALRLEPTAKSEGNPLTTYRIPRGDWFNYVSCPHYLAEILMYASLAAILGWQNTTGLVIFAWVFMNQVVSALMSHFWYQDKFDDYPRSRKAIFPRLL